MNTNLSLLSRNIYVTNPTIINLHWLSSNFFWITILVVFITESIPAAGFFVYRHLGLGWINIVLYKMHQAFKKEFLSAIK